MSRELGPEAGTISVFDKEGVIQKRGGGSGGTVTIVGVDKSTESGAGAIDAAISIAEEFDTDVVVTNVDPGNSKVEVEEIPVSKSQSD